MVVTPRDDRTARMPTPAETAEQFLTALAKLPPFAGLTFRGLGAGDPEPPALGLVVGVLPTSRDPRVASENGTAPRLLALLHRTGRSLEPFSAHPWQGEVVVRPDTAWQRLLEVPVAGLASPVLLLAELDPDGAPMPVTWPPTLEAVAALVERTVAEALGAGPVDVPVPGKFAGPWTALEPRP